MSQGLVESLFGAVAERIAEMPGEIMQEAVHQVGAGAHELAAALFSPGGNAFVMYQRQPNAHDNEMSGPELEQGMSM